jgi:isopentenyldiphosphate isomerase
VSFLDRIAACNNARTADYLPLMGFGRRIGWVRRDRAGLLGAHASAFRIEEGEVALVEENRDRAEAALDQALAELAAAGHIEAWRGERYRVAERYGAPTLMTIERAAAPFLGVRSWGVHMTGYVRRKDGGLDLWIAERAHDKPTYPGELDNTVAGGQPAELGLLDNLVKECAEEAAIPEDLARRAQAVGAVSYRHAQPAGLKPDEMFCYDLELPEDFTPRNTDGEVHAFMRLPAEEVIELVRETERFKFNCALVLIDFFIRRGLITPDDEPDYAEICSGLRQG